MFNNWYDICIVNCQRQLNITYAFDCYCDIFDNMTYMDAWTSEKQWVTWVAVKFECISRCVGNSTYLNAEIVSTFFQ